MFASRVGYFSLERKEKMSLLRLFAVQANVLVLVLTLLLTLLFSFSLVRCLIRCLALSCVGPP